LLHAIATASVLAMTSASVEGQDLQILHSGDSAIMLLPTTIGRPRFERSCLQPPRPPDVVIGQRERVIALRIFGKGLAAHTLYEQRERRA
jgi:hypothetical protein